MSEYKKRVEAAINKWSTKQLPKPKRKPNKNPEGEFVLVLKKHLESQGFSIDVVEAKAVFSEESQRYTNGKTRPGFPDMVGNSPSGISVWIEVKAPGRRNTVRPDQHEFLIGKIATNCFAIVCDSTEYFDRAWNEYRASHNKKALLLRELPKLADRWAKLMGQDLDFDDL